MFFYKSPPNLGVAIAIDPFNMVYTPLKINMEHDHGGLEQNFAFFSWAMAVGSSR